MGISSVLFQGCGDFLSVKVHLREVPSNIISKGKRVNLFRVPSRAVHRISTERSQRTTRPEDASATSLKMRRVTTPKPKTHVQREEEEIIKAFWDYQRLFVSQRCEMVDEVALRVVEGRVPDDVEGAYFLAGPGLFEDDHGSSVHPLDGHGYLRKFKISSSSVFYSARYVETEAKTTEHDTEKDGWRFTYRGPFSVLKSGERIGNMKIMKNVANTSVLYWSGKLMCLWEGGHPYEIDPHTLSTIGPSRILWNKSDAKTDKRKEQVNKKSTKAGLIEIVRQRALHLGAFVLQTFLAGTLNMPRERVLSHFKTDATRNRIVLLTCECQDMLLPISNFCFYELDSSMRVVQRKKFQINEQTMVHDWALTESHYIIFSNRVKFNVSGSLGAVCGVQPMISTVVPDVQNEEEGSSVYIFPRFDDDPKSNQEWKNPLYLPTKLWVLHVANSFEETDSQSSLKFVIHASVCSYKWFSFERMFGYDQGKRLLNPQYMNMESPADTNHPATPHIVKISIRLHSCSGAAAATSVIWLKSWTNSCDFPTVNTEISSYKNRYIYVAGNSRRRRYLKHFPFDSIVKIDTEKDYVPARRWWAGPRSFVGEPSFVPRKRKTKDVLDSPSASSVDDGYILFVQYEVGEQKCYLVMLDARRMLMAARLEIPAELFFPLGFHGFWVSCP